MIKILKDSKYTHFVDTYIKVHAASASFINTYTHVYVPFHGNKSTQKMNAQAVGV